MEKTVLTLSRKSALAVAVILLPVLITFIYSYTENRRHIKEQVLSDLHTVTEAYDVVVTEFIEMSKRRTEDFASDGLIRVSLSGMSMGQKIDAQTLARHLVKNKRPLDTEISAIHVIAPDGIIAASTDLSSAGRDVSARPYFTEGLSSTAVTETSDLDTAVPYLTVSSPVKDVDTGRVIGVLSNVFSLKELSTLLTEHLHARPGATLDGFNEKLTMEAYLVNNDGLMLTESRFVESAVLTQRVGTHPVAACRGSGEEVTGFYDDYRGVPVVGSSKCVKPLGWTLLVEIDAAEALAPVRQMRRNAAVAGVIVVTLIILLYLAFHRTVLARLRSLSRAARTVSEGDYGVTIPEGPGDEIGVLTSTFNVMTSQIKARDIAIKNHDESLKRAQRIAHLGNWDWDIEKNTLWWSDEIYRIFGLDPGGFGATYEAFINHVDARDRDLVKKAVYRSLYEDEPYSIDHRIVLPDGTEKVVHEEADVVFNDERRPLRMIGTVQDITDRKRAEEEMRMLAKFPTENPNPVVRVSMDGCVQYANEASGPILSHWGYDEKTGMVDAERQMRINDVYRSGKSLEVEVTVGSKVYSIFITPVLESGYLYVYGVDITRRKKSEFELKKLSAAIEQSVNLVFITDVNGVIEYVNPKFERVTGYTKDEAMGQTPRILSSGETPNSAYNVLWSTIKAGKTWRNVFKNRTKSGGNYWCNTVVSPIQNERGETTHFLAVQEDVTERMLSEERLERMATYDDVTGLINRSRFISRVDEWIGRASESGQTGTLILLDIDQFKFLNDTFGHATGDVFLRRLAKMIADTVPGLYRKAAPDSTEDPVIGRMSGDEFSILLPDTGEQAGLLTAEALREAISTFRFTDEFGALTVSAGVVSFPEHGSTASGLFTRADAALYRAKDLGRNKCHLYRPEDRDLENMHSRTEWKEKIQKALKESRFEPWFQPILSLKDNSIHHYEVLARMRDVDGSILLPGAFIEVAERFGLVGQIDRMIIEKTIKRQAAMRALGRDLSFSVNLSGLDLGDEDLLAFLKSRITKSARGPGGIVFEITETAAVNDMARAKRFIQELKSLGCRFSLDDFGVGFTSFVYLKELAVDFIKIDGSFIKRLHENADDQVFVKAMKEVAQGLGIQTIAEFVENGEVLEILRRFGIDYGQGYHIGKPVPSLEFSDSSLLWSEQYKAQ